MGLKYYLNLMKKESDIEAVKLRYLINIFIFLAYMVLLVMYFSLRNTNVVLSGVCGMASLLFLILHYIFELKFRRFLADIIKNEPLDETDKTDAAFIAYRRGYTEAKYKDIFSNKIFLISQIIIAATFIAGLQLCIVLNITGNLDLSNRIFSIVHIVMWAFFALIMVLSFFGGMKNGMWYQSYINELDIIKEFKAEQQGISGNPIKRKYKILEDKKPKEQLKYLFADEELCKKASRLQKIGTIFGGIMGGALGFSFIAPSIIFQSIGLSEDKAGFYSGLILVILLCAIVVFCTWNTCAISKVRKTQYKILKENEAENNLFIKLHDLRTPFYKRWGIVILLGIAGAIVSNIAFAGVVSVLAKTDAYGWIFTLMIFVEIIAIFVIYFKAFAKLRFKMIPIEKEIDKQRGSVALKDAE